MIVKHNSRNGEAFCGCSNYTSDVNKCSNQCPVPRGKGKAEAKMREIKIYNKLVRDRIPEIISAAGKICTTEVLSDEDYLRMLDAKLDEELAEYHKDRNIEELADLLEVLRATAVAHGYTLEELERVRAEKAEKRGGFEKRILLKDVGEA